MDDDARFVKRRLLCPDGKRRLAYVSSQDTPTSAPAVMVVRGTQIRGTVVRDDGALLFVPWERAHLVTDC